MRNILLITICMLSSQAIAQIDTDFFLIARNTGVKTLADSSIVRVMGFAVDLGSQPDVPGPTLIVTEGDSVEIDLWNVSQGAPHTIHLHGLDVDQANDGVPHLSFEIDHMDHGYYRFEAPHPGTYLYHCHVASTIHVQAGMYGMIIVKEKDAANLTWTNGFEFDREFSFLSSEIDTFWHQDSVILHDYENQGSLGIPIPEYNPQYFLLNGYSDQQLEAEGIKVYGAKGEQILIRLANVGFLGNRFLFPPKLNTRIISSDGRPLPDILNVDSLTVLPGERYQLLINPIQVLNDSIIVSYFSMNNMKVEGKQLLDVEILETASLKASDHSTFSIYPNPASKELFFQLSNAQGRVLLVISDLQGKAEIEKEFIISESGMFKTELDLNEGLYVLRIFNSEGMQIATKKLIVNY